jgi:ATP-dependent protease HslVU (ClpYQ) peptidase subunit
MVRTVKEYCKEWRQDVSVSKANVMLVCKNDEKVAKVGYGEEEIKRVNQYIYLNTIFSPNRK